MTSTLYEPAGPTMSPLFERASGRVILNKGYLEGSEGRNRSVYQQTLQNKGLEVIPYSNPASINRIHMKTYTGDEGDRRTGFISTSNLSESSVVSTPSSSITRKLSYLANRLSFGLAGKSLYQLNAGVKITDSNTVSQLTSIQNQIASGSSPTSTRNFLIGADASDSIIADIRRVKRGSTITVASPYIDDPALINALAKASAQGADVRLITSNPNSTVPMASGGNTKAISQAIQTLRSAGVDVYLPDKGDPLLTHTKAVTIQGNGQSIGYIGSHNLTGAARRRESLDLMFRTEGTLGQELQRKLMGDAEGYGLTKLSGLKTQQYGYTNSQLNPFFDSDSDVKYILPSRRGLSYFYELAVFNAARQNAGLSTINPTEMSGYAAAAFNLRYAANHGGELPSQTPEWALRYDREMNSPGLGFYINQWGIANGYGRLYQDEKGALASVTGMIGSVFDRAFNYYNPNNRTPDWIAEQQDIKAGSEYKEPSTGFFQSTFTFATNFALTTATSMLTYFTLGMPYEAITSEVTRLSVQGMLDTALGQGNIHPLARSGAALAALGPEYAGKNPQAIKRLLMKRANAEGEIDIYTHLFSQPGMENILQRRRAGILFDHIVKPFILDVVNPYSPTSADGLVNPHWQQLRNSLDNFGAELRKTTKLKFEESGRLVLVNEGFARKQSVAKSLDELAMMIPANPLKWGWKGKNFTNPETFLAMGDILNFSGLVQTIESIYFDNNFDQILVNSERVNELGGANRIVAKMNTFARIPGQILKSATARLSQSDALLGPILGEYRKLRSVQESMIKQGILQWDNQSNTRRIDGEGEELDAFFNQIMSYQEKVTLDPSREMKLTNRATKFFNEQNLRLNKLKSVRGKLTSHPILNHLGTTATVVAGLLAGEMILSDVLGTTGSNGAASLYSQLILSLHHDEAAPAEFTPSYLISSGNRQLDTAAWIGTALAGGYAGASITQGVQVERYGFSTPVEKAIANWAEKAAYKTAGKTLSGAPLAQYMEEILNRGILTPKGNFFRNFAVGTASILLMGKALNWTAAAGLNLFRSIPGIGPALLGEGNVELNNNLTLVTQLGNLRGNILRRLDAGEKLSDLELGGAYQAGILSQMTSIVDDKAYAPDVRVVAEQAPLPFFQFFFTETIKGRTFDENNKIKNKGISSYGFGIQTAPILGGNLSFGLPIALNLDAKNRLGVSLVYNDQANVITFLNAMAAVGSTSLGLALGLLAVTEGTAGAVKLFNKEAGILEDLTQMSNSIRSTAKLVDSSLEVLVSLPEVGLNAVRGFKTADADAWLQMGKTVFQAHSKHPLLKLGKIAAAAGLGLGAGQFAARVFTDDEKVIWWSGVAAAGLGVAAFGSDRVYKNLTSKVAPFTGSVFNRVSEEFEKRTLSKLPTRYLGVGAVVTASAWLMTDSEFGVSVNMDNSMTDKIMTVGLYAALFTPVITHFSDFGRSPKQTLELYKKIEGRVVTPAQNPLAWLGQQHDRYKLHKLKGDLERYSTLSREFVDEAYALPNGVNQKERLLESLKTDQQLGEAFVHIRDGYNSKIKEFLQDENLTNSFQRITARQEFKAFMRGRSQAGSRILRGFVAFAGVTALTQTAVQTIGYVLGGRANSQSAVDAFYNHVDGIPIVGQALGNMFRLVTWRDKSSTLKGVDLIKTFYQDPTHKNIKQLGVKLIQKQDPDKVKLQQTLSDLLSPLAIDPSNSYQSVLPGVGLTFRDGEFGAFSRTSSYLQVQSAGQDISTAVYSMSQSTLKRSALQNKGELRHIIETTYKRITGKTVAGKTTPEQDRYLSNLILSSTAELQALPSNKRRRFNTPVSDSVGDLIGGDSLMAFSLRERMRRTEQLSYQKRENIASRMSDYSDLSSLIPVGSHIDPNNPITALSSLMSGDNQKLVSSRSNYTQILNYILGSRGNINIKALSFAWDRKKLTVNSNDLALSDTSEWSQYQSVYLDQDQLKETNNFEVINKSFQNVDQFLSILPFLNNDLIRTGVYMAAGLGGVWFGLGLAGSFAYQHDSAAVLQALETPRSLFQVEPDNLPFRVGDGFNTGSRRLVVQRGATRFSLDLPEEFESGFGNRIKGGLVKIQQEIGGLTQTLIKDVFEVSDSLDWKSLAREEVVGSLTTRYTGIFDQYVDQVVDKIISTQVASKMVNGKIGGSYTFGSLLPGDFSEVKNTLKTQLQNDLAELFEKEVSQGGEQLLTRYTLRSEKEMGRYLGMLVFQKTQNLFKQIQSNLLVMTPDDLTSAMHMEKTLIDIIKEQGGRMFGSKELGEELRSRTMYTNTLSDVEIKGDIEGLERIGQTQARGRLSRWRVVGRAARAGMVLFSLLEPVEIFTAYSRLGALQDDRDATTGDERYARQHVGWVTTNSLVMGIGLGQLIHKAPEWIKALGKIEVIESLMARVGTKGRVGLTIAAVLGVAALGLAFSKKIGETLEAVQESSWFQSGTKVIGQAYDATSDFVGEVLGEYIPTAVNKLSFGIVRKGAVTSAIGGVGAGVITALALAGVVTLGAGVAASAGAIAAIAAIGGAVGFGLGLIPGFNRFAGDLLGNAMNSLNKASQGWLGTPLNQLFQRASNQYHDRGPIYSATAQEALAQENKNMLLLASDPTGRSTKQLFTNPTLYGQSAGDLDSAAAQSTIKPRSLMNPLLDRELQIKAQYFNQMIVGRAMWSQLIKGADNYQQLKQFSSIRAQASGSAQLTHKQLEGQKEKELQDIQKHSAHLTKGKQVGGAEANLASSLYTSIVSMVHQTGACIKKTFWIPNQTFNDSLQQANQNIAAAYGKAPILVTQVQAVKSGNGVQIQENIATTNDLVVAITRGLVNPLNIVRNPT